jgi:murein DD-endopeptidase MepM/ murein hydrolase activator NlpD
MSATTLADLATRLEIADRAAEYDQSLLDGLASDRAVLSVQQQELEQIQTDQLAAQAELDARRADLDAVLGEEQATLAALDQAKADALALVQQASTAHAQALQQQALAEAEQKAAQARFEAFQAAHGGAFVPGVLNVCPVDQPRAYGDSFGAPRYVGGYHPHAGNDILAPSGTPVRAPFDGMARDATNDLGGLSVIVEGTNGYVYNAHLSYFGQLGPVTAGTVIGYVGHTGTASGGVDHDHFEWHPNVIPANPWVSPYGYSVIGTAVDPFPYLNAVC